MNNTFNKGINRTPFEALFGIRLAGSKDNKVVSELGDDVTDIIEIRENINSHMRLSQQKAKEHYDKRRCKPRSMP